VEDITYRSLSRLIVCSARHRPSGGWVDTRTLELVLDDTGMAAFDELVAGGSVESRRVGGLVEFRPVG
jgi:hypothetical protein